MSLDYRLCSSDYESTGSPSTTFRAATVTYLGHIVGQSHCQPKKTNTESILQFGQPCTRKALQCFLGMAGYYRRYCRNFSSVAALLMSLTSGKVPFIWTPQCQQAFETLKHLLASDPVLRSPDFTKPFILHVDASIEGIGAVLLQRDDSTEALHPVCYHSAKLLPHQRAYATVEKEALALVSTLKKFECYLGTIIKPPQSTRTTALPREGQIYQPASSPVVLISAALQPQH